MNLKTRIDKLQAQAAGGPALCSPLANDLYHWPGHEGEYTLEQIQGALSPDDVLLVLDLPGVVDEPKATS